MARERTGCIYSEMTNKGRCSAKYIKGAPPVYCFRWVAEVTVHGKRYRFRSTIRHNAEMWLQDKLAKATPILCGRKSPNYGTRHKINTKEV